VRPDELLLQDEPEAVRAAREFVAQSLVGSSPDLIVDAQLLATELVTNARLHGVPPIMVGAVRHLGRVRLEVEDAGQTLPVRTRDSLDSMTGRGLTLVSALASSWGVDPGSDGGKVVMLAPDATDGERSFLASRVVTLPWDMGTTVAAVAS